jgi:hypothetical protein
VQSEMELAFAALHQMCAPAGRWVRPAGRGDGARQR